MALPEQSPERIFGLRDGSFAADLFIAAVSHFDLFNRLAAGPVDFPTLCASLGIRERPADVMLTLCKAYGFIIEMDSRYSLTATAGSFLTAGAEYDLSSYISSLKGRPVCRDMVRVLRTGQPAAWAASRTGDDWTTQMEDDGFSADFTSSMNSRGTYLARGLADAIPLTGCRRLLDIGGASGIYAQVLLERNPGLAATVFEKPPVDRVADYAIRTAGTGDRMDVHAGDMFQDELPAGHDVHLLSHVLHDWDVPAVAGLLANSFRNLAPGGRLLVHDAHLNEDKTGPLSVAEYSVLLMFSTEGKCYSFGEMKSLLEAAGFRDISWRPTILNRSVVSARKPKK